MRATLDPAECQVICVVNRRVHETHAELIQSRCNWLAELSERLDMQLTEEIVDLEAFPRAEILMELRQKLRAPYRRRRLLIAGTYLEDVISIVTLEALYVGLDPYLLGDLIQAKDGALSQLVWQRLIHAGAVPTTMGQVLIEWSYASARQEDIVAINSLATSLDALCQIQRAPRVNATGLA